MLQKIASSKKIDPDHYVLQADAGGSAPSTNQGFNSVQPGAEQFVMKVPNNKVDFFFFPFVALSFLSYDEADANG